MHPIVIIASDKDPAIGAAVEGLEAAGFEVRVLNSATAKLVDFLGALAGEDDGEDDEEEPKPAPSVRLNLPPAAEVAPAKDGEDDEDDDAEDPLHPSKMEALINGEPIEVELVDGPSITLHPNSISAGARTSYTLNESQFSFWPSAISNAPITGIVELLLHGEDPGHLAKVVFSEEAMAPPVLKIGRGWLREAGYPHDSWSLLPASEVLYGKAKVSVEDIRSEMHDKGVILVCTRDDKGIFLLTSYGHIAKPGTVRNGHNDQTWRKLGSFHVIGTIELGKTPDDDKVEYEDEDQKKFDPATLKGPVYVFK